MQQHQHSSRPEQHQIKQLAFGGNYILEYCCTCARHTLPQPYSPTERVAGKGANTGDAKLHPQYPVSRRTNDERKSRPVAIPALPRLELFQDAQHSPIKKSVISDTGTNSAVTLCEAAININETAVATELHFSAPTRPSRCSEHNHMAKYAPDERRA